MLESLAAMTWKNPIFMMVFFGALWFLPGILLRRVAKAKNKEKKEKEQLEKIQRLYPKD